MKNVVKDVVQEGSKENEKEGRKVFTRRITNDIINKDYNPLKVNYRLIYNRRDGLYKMKNEILNEIKKDLNLKERIIVQINKKTFLKVFNKTRIETINKLMK